RQRRGCCEVDDQAKGHADAGSRESKVPTEFFAKRSTDERRQKRPEIDAHIEDREGAVAASVAGRIKGANLSRNIGLEGSVAENKKAERKQKQLFKCHHEVANGHQNGSHNDRAALAEHSISQQSPQDRR